MKFQKKHCVAMLLAGGQGSRLLALTRNTAKPAVPFGGKYRIIDFPLSNCVNSGIDTVGILTQYQPLELNEYIGNGQPWNLNKAHGGVQILPPYARSKNSEWYKGTANAVYQNFSFIDRYDPEHILVLSGDHIYTMRYDEMLLEHERKKADCTIAVRQVPMDQASRFGILNLGPDGAITEFAEKPEHPKSDLASMGIYIFRWEVLRKALEDDEKLRGSSHDFGKDVIPRLLKEGRRMFAYRFGGYWKDVGTIESLWQANMDLLGPAPQFVLRDGRTTLYARNDACPGSFLAKTAKISDSLIAEGCEIAGRVQESVVSTGCRIEEGAVVERSVLMPNVTVRAGAKISHAIVAEECTVCTGAAIGQRPQEGQQAQITVIGKGMELPAQSCVCAGEMVERGQAE